MGLQIGEIIPKKEISLEQLQGKIIAVDAFNTLYQFLSNIRQPDGTPLMDRKGHITSHLSGLFYRTTNLMTRGLKLVFVFDGTPPELKYRTKARREEAKEEAKAKYEAAKRKGKTEEMGKYAKQFATLNEEMINESKELISALGLTAIQAPSEGEAQAAFMAKQGDVYAAASQDYDALLFSSPRLIQNLTLARKRRLPSGAFTAIQPELIELNTVLGSLKISHEQLVCLGILIGTDYNPGGIRGIGPKTALQLVKKHKKCEDIFKALEKEQKYEINFNWHEIFELFKKPDVTKKYSIKFKEFDEAEIKNLLVKKHDFSEERINSALEKLQKRKEATQQQGLGKFLTGKL